jgi:hypothetical protein
MPVVAVQTSLATRCGSASKLSRGTAVPAAVSCSPCSRTANRTRNIGREGSRRRPACSLTRAAAAVASQGWHPVVSAAARSSRLDGASYGEHRKSQGSMPVWRAHLSPQLGSTIEQLGRARRAGLLLVRRPHAAACLLSCVTAGEVQAAARGQDRLPRPPAAVHPGQEQV